MSDTDGKISRPSPSYHMLVGKDGKVEKINKRRMKYTQVAVINIGENRAHLGIIVEGISGYFTKEMCNTDQIGDKAITESGEIEYLENLTGEMELCENCWPRE